MSVDCTKCIHEKTCELWGIKEGQDACYYDQDSGETAEDFF